MANLETRTIQVPIPILHGQNYRVLSQNMGPPQMGQNPED